MAAADVVSKLNPHAQVFSPRGLPDLSISAQVRNGETVSSVLISPLLKVYDLKCAIAAQSLGQPVEQLRLLLGDRELLDEALVLNCLCSFLLGYRFCLPFGLCFSLLCSLVFSNLPLCTDKTFHLLRSDDALVLLPRFPAVLTFFLLELVRLEFLATVWIGQ